MTVHSFPLAPRAAGSAPGFNAATTPTSGDKDATTVRGGSVGDDEKGASRMPDHLEAVLERASAFIEAGQQAALADLDMPATAVASGLPDGVTQADLAHVIDASQRTHLDGCDFASDCSCFC